MKTLAFLSVLLVLVLVCFNIATAHAQPVRIASYYVEELTPEQLEQEKIEWLRQRNKERMKQICETKPIECAIRKFLTVSNNNE